MRLLQHAAVCGSDLQKHLSLIYVSLACVDLTRAALAQVCAYDICDTLLAGDFPVVATGMDTSANAVQDRFSTYIDTLCNEINLHAVINTAPLQTVSFGGGTPSLIPPSLLEIVLSTVDQRFGIAPDAEISMEADPGTFDAQKLRVYMQLGVNRFSMGVQAFDEVRARLVVCTCQLQDMV